MSGVAQKPRPTLQERERRKKRRAWISTAVIGGLIVIAVVVAIVIHAGGAGKPVVLKAGDTRFDRAGVKAMTREADAQIDVRSAQRASAIGLPPNATKTFGPFSDIAAELDLVGVHGIDSLFVDSFTVTTKNDYLTKITTVSHEFGFTSLRDQLKAEGVVGISTKQMGRFEDAVPAGAGGPTSYFTLAVGTGTDLGVPTRVSVACAGPKGCTVDTVTIPPSH